MVAYGRLKTKENYKLSSLKVVAVAYERWSLMRGSNYSDLAGQNLVFWKSGSSREVVAYKRWSQGEVRLYQCHLGDFFYQCSIILICNFFYFSYF